MTCPDDRARAAVWSGGGPAGDRHVDEGELLVEGQAVRRFAIFSDDDWNHLRLVLTAAPDAAAIGLGIALPGGSAPDSGPFAVVERAGAGWRLAVYQRVAGGELTRVDGVDLPNPADAAVPVALE